MPEGSASHPQGCNRGTAWLPSCSPLDVLAKAPAPVLPMSFLGPEPSRTYIGHQVLDLGPHQHHPPPNPHVDGFFLGAVNPLCLSPA